MQRNEGSITHDSAEREKILGVRVSFECEDALASRLLQVHFLSDAEFGSGMGVGVMVCGKDRVIVTWLCVLRAVNHDILASYYQNMRDIVVTCAPDAMRHGIKGCGDQCAQACETRSGRGPPAVQVE